MGGHTSALFWHNFRIIVSAFVVEFHKLINFAMKINYTCRL